MIFTLAQVAGSIGISASPASPAGPGVTVTGWSIDTRTLKPGDLFFALRGPTHNGHDFIQEALAQGASAVIAEYALTQDSRMLIVPNVLAALQQIAAWARNQWPGDGIGITGSAGKTSTKDIVAALLSTRLRTGKTEGNFNNHYGLPLSILRLPADAQVAVLEFGMNHAGEIKALAAIARPRIAIITIVGTAHIEFFDSIAGIAAAKRELVESLPPGGVAILNADDARVAAFAPFHPGHTITYGLSPNAEVRADNVEFTREGTRFQHAGIAFETKLPGRHGVRNILAGIAAASLYGIPPAALREAIAQLQPGTMRGKRSHHRGMELINDCYNSSPDAAMSMLDVLHDTPAQRRIAVLGEMLELGPWSETLHREVGRYAAQSGIDVLVAIRGAAKNMADAAISVGLPAGAAFFFEDPAQAGAALQSMARPGDAILFKGSRGTHVERALDAFLAEVRVNS